MKVKSFVPVPESFVQTKCVGADVSIYSIHLSS